MSDDTLLRFAKSGDGTSFQMFAPPTCRRRWRNNAFPFRQIRRRRRQPSEHRTSEASNQTLCARASRDFNTLCERR